MEGNDGDGGGKMPAEEQLDEGIEGMYYCCCHLLMNPCLIKLTEQPSSTLIKIIIMFR